MDLRFFTSKDSVFVKEVESCTGISQFRTVPYFTDGSIFNKESTIPMILLGPGLAEMAHQPNEFVYIKSYLDAIEHYKKIIRHTLRTSY
ncbi:M20/M25/M40 family metallo-hydrolase [Thalassobacillus sp. C254]|uniref:M20/M25/M40 family metallo-hydrolase n=1 Tax=Thalassobacillus sp. C254 TaxID=1225341 RepID=UPI0012ED7339